MNEPLSLETYALALAHLLRRRGEPIANVLGSLNITAVAFKEAEVHWTRELEQSLVRRKGILAMKFASTFAEARMQVGLLDPTDGSVPAFSPKAQPAAELPSFLKEQSAPGAAAPSPWAPAAPVPPSIERLPKNRGATLVRESAAAISPLLPFQEGSPATALAPALPPIPRGVGTGTAMLDSDAPAQMPVMPFGSDLPSLTLEQYASLVVELTRRPPNVEPLLTRYGIHSHEQHRRLEAAMKAHLHSDPALRARFDALIMRFSAMARP
jgi:hypothetical protein